MFGNIATYDGHAAGGLGLTGILYETRAYQMIGKRITQVLD